jgi:two-component system, chemotaxis family, CheB/CheR fusion protein
VTSGPEFEIDPEDARHAILLFHELATNAAKYGSLSHPRGRVFVNWEWNETACTLTWRGVGGPTIAPPTSMGFFCDACLLLTLSRHWCLHRTCPLSEAKRT